MEKNVDIQQAPRMPLGNLGQVQNTPTIAISRPQAVTIISCLNGYAVHVGCQSVVFETREKMLSEIERYLKNPSKVEKEYLEQQ